MGLRGKLGKNSFSEAFADIVCIFGIVQNFLNFLVISSTEVVSTRKALYSSFANSTIAPLFGAMEGVRNKEDSSGTKPKASPSFVNDRTTSAA